MRKLMFLALLAATAAFTQQAPASKARVLTRVELDTLLAQPGKVLLIDVRRPDEISSNGGFAVYLSIQAGDLEKHLAEIPRDKVIVTVSNHAARGGKAADLLADHGFNVAGTIGAETYESEGGKLVRIAIPPPRSSEKK
jgi:rhodanese-related sulfurtransferase